MNMQIFLILIYNVTDSSNFYIFNIQQYVVIKNIINETMLGISILKLQKIIIILCSNEILKDFDYNETYFILYFILFFHIICIIYLFIFIIRICEFYKL